MGILKHLLFWPATGPIALARFSLGQVDGAVRKELTDDAPVKEELLELQLLLELGEVDEDQYVAREAELMERLRETRHWREQFGLQAAWKPLGSGSAGAPSASPPVPEPSDPIHSDPGVRTAQPPFAAAGSSLLDRLPGRFTFVVGKGGVGKSTTAGALALALADSGHSTHLLSTDPAHSLGDLFAHPLPAGETAVLPDSPGLTIEELDAATRGEAWVRRLAEGAAELVELGTYLDAADVTSLIEPALPGLGELVAAIRLTELEESGVGRIVVDTAPTGHALRLLECGEMLDGWIQALDAMAAKAEAVHGRLQRRTIRLGSQVVLDEFRERALRFEQRILPAADFLIVSTPDPLVHLETERLADRLGSMGCRVAVRVETHRSAGFGSGRVAPEGPAALRRWWTEEGWRNGGQSEKTASPEAGVSESFAPSSTPPQGSEALLARFLKRDLIFFAGKGGVGKSTCSAACAVAVARERPVLLLGADPAGSLGDLLAGELDTAHRLQVREVDSEREFQAFRDRYVGEIREAFARLGLDRSVPLDRNVMESLLGLAPPGIDEIFGLRALLEGVVGDDGARNGRAIVVDTAPTGHFLRLIEMPEPAIAWSRAVMRLILKYRSVLGLENLAPGLLEFAKDLRDLVELLGDPERTGVVVVTLDQPMVQAETSRLLATLQERKMPIALVLMNRHRSEGPTAGRPDPPKERGIGSDIPLAVAPELSSPPSGESELDGFFSRWQVI